MKKIFSLSALMLMLVVALTGCKEDTQPRLEIPTEFQLNTPELASQIMYVDRGGSIQFSCSQANYGLGTTPTYQLEISDTKDFVKSELVSYTTTNAVMTIPAEPFATAVCSLYGWQDPEDVTDVPVYVRCISSIPKAAEEYTIKSNVVELSRVLVYFAVKLPDAIYLVGQPNDWKVDVGVNEMPIYETEPESGIYKGTVHVDEGKFQFRFYNELGDWNMFSIGAQDEDSPVDITFTDGEYSGDCFYDPTTEKAGKGAWQCNTWPGGDVEITVNLNTLSVVFKAL